MSITVIPVTGKALLHRFIEVPYMVHCDDPLWIPPLRIERKQTFSPRYSEFFRRADVGLFIAQQDGRDVGRISAQIDPLLT
ncbi:MAG: dATP pyrophosphohydrolase, partial [Alphaproteobacteria bacterium]|nr:dATP pyrophosphohydrolase [Alphaproteobacteria bacterium]